MITTLRAIPLEPATNFAANRARLLAIVTIQFLPAPDADDADLAEFLKSATPNGVKAAALVKDGKNKIGMSFLSMAKRRHPRQARPTPSSWR